MKINNKIKNTIFIILIISVIIVIIANVFWVNNKDFWDSSITSCLTILVALVVSYYFTKMNQDEKNQKDSYQKVIEKMQVIVNDECMCKIEKKEDVTCVLMNKRKLNNTMTLLKKYSEKFGLQDEMIFIDEHVQEYATFFGNHQDDLAYLKSSEIDLRRPLELIDNKLQEAMLKMYE